MLTTLSTNKGDAGYVDVKLLIKQKRSLFDVLVDAENMPKKVREHLEGILELLDWIYDELDPPST